VPEGALFCPKCGTRTGKGEKAEPISRKRDWEVELESAAEKIGQEMEKAFSIAGKEIEKAFNSVKEKLKTLDERETVVCPNCGDTNREDATFCYKCGTKLVQ
jgi:ribosomal protein L40E